MVKIPSSFSMSIMVQQGSFAFCENRLAETSRVDRRKSCFIYTLLHTIFVPTPFHPKPSPTPFGLRINSGEGEGSHLCIAACSHSIVRSLYSLLYLPARSQRVSSAYLARSK